MTQHDVTKDDIKAFLINSGFDIAGCVSVTDLPNISKNFIPWLEAGFHGDLNWLINNAEKRSTVTKIMTDVGSAFVVGLNYAPDKNPLSILNYPNQGAISVYAQNDDYHDVMKKRLKSVAHQLNTDFSMNVRIFVDTAPVHEKSLAQTAGIGWQGKHTNLVSRQYGSWLFLGVLLCDRIFESDVSEINHCGSCTKCLTACPTDAFINPYMMDARKCISYLTIEYKGVFPQDLAKKIGNYIYGCDICLSVCPWNKFAQTASESAFHARHIANNPPLQELIVLNDAEFRTLFAKSPIKRIGHDRFIRNILNAMGNSGNTEFMPYITPFLTHENDVVRITAGRALELLV